MSTRPTPARSPLVVASTTPITTSAPIKPVKKKVTELECAEVRWFYMKPGDNKWTPFNGYDSMSLELNYRRIHNIPLDSKAATISDQFPQTDKIFVLDNLYEWDPNNDVDSISSVYWKDDSVRIRRGTWFFADTLQPLESDFAEEIETHHLKHFRDQGIPDTPVFSENESNKRPILTTLKWHDHDEVRWNSVIDILFYNNTKTNRFMRLVTRAKGVYALKRGYTIDADMEEGRPEFSDLILVIHGIGQKGYENLIAKNTSQIREAIDVLMQKHYPNEKRRPMVLPIEWRSALVLDGELTDIITLPRMLSFRNTLNSVAMDIMYYQSPLYRQEIINGVIKCLNATYAKFIESHPTFKGPVSILAHSLGSVIAYDIITKWSPLMLYDEYITNSIEKRRESAETDEQRQLFTDFHDSRKRLLEKDGYLHDILLCRDEQLSFKVKFLFCVGSPLAVFIIMRGKTDDFVPDENLCERVLNIFHPYDPVAYRLEPLFHHNYKHIRPVRIFNHSESSRDYDKVGFDVHKSYLKKLHKREKKKEKQKNSDPEENKPHDGIEEDDDDNSDSDEEDYSSGGSPRSKSPITEEDPDHLPPNNVHTSSGSGRWWRFGGGGANTVMDVKKDNAEKVDEKKAQTDEKKSPLDALLDAIPEDKKIPRRLDFHVKTSFTDMSYLSLMKAHFAYWTNTDLVAFVLNQLYAGGNQDTQEQNTP